MGMPGSTLASGGYPMEVIQRPEQITLIQEAHSELRRIFIGQPRVPDTDLFPTRNGYSTGRWEGDTLVVETSHFNDKTPLDFHSSHGTKLKVTERFQKQKTKGGYTDLVVHITIEDPEHFTKPFTVVRHWPFRSDMANTLGSDGITEYSCEENNRNVEMSSDGRVIIK